MNTICIPSPSLCGKLGLYPVRLPRSIKLIWLAGGSLAVATLCCCIPAGATTAAVAAATAAATASVSLRLDRQEVVGHDPLDFCNASALGRGMVKLEESAGKQGQSSSRD